MSSKSKQPSPLTSPMEPQGEKDICPDELQEVKQLLARTPADDYGVWLEVGCALKRLGVPYEVFSDWSAKSEKFDEDECAQKWENLPDEPRAGWPTLRKNAAASSFVPVREEMLPEPQTEDECAAQAAHYLASTFKPGETFELCGWKEDPTGKRLVPNRGNELSWLGDGDTEDVLCKDETLRSWVRDGILGGVVVGLNPVRLPENFKGYAPTDEMVSDYRVCLLESDKIPIEDQWAKLKQMRLPIASAVYSGGKSLHVRCFIDAGEDMKLFKERVEKLIKYANSFGFVADTCCRNPSRLARLAGGKRDGKRQYAVCWECGYPDWDTFELCELGYLNAKPMKPSTSFAGGSSRNQYVCAPQTAMPSDQEENKNLDELEAEFGEPLTFSSKGTVTAINESFWAAYVMRKHGLIKVSGIIWRYAKTTGLWLRVSAEELNNLIAKTARDYGTECGIGELATKFNEPTCNHIRKFMKNAKKDLFKDRPRDIIHVGNGMVEPHDDGTCILKPFSPIYYSRNQSEITYDPNAQCPMFKEKLLGPMLPQDDIEIIQRYSGQCLLGYNHTQTFLMLTGTAGGGKGTIVNLIRGIIGEANCVELRTELLGERFELARFIGKTFLIGSDVPSDFLIKKGAGKIKSLCGWDPLDGEVKGQTDPVPLIGDYNIAITANSRLRVNVDGDIDAWRRRMLWITFEKPRPEKRITDFAGVLLREEGPGILNWMIEGAVKLLQNGFPSESMSSRRVERLLQESNSIYGFLTTCVEKTDSKANITVDELVSKYNTWCLANDWEPFVGLIGRRKLLRGMETLFHVPKVNSIDRDGDQRGFNGVRFKEPDNQ